jgi:hypothetical protein
VIYTNDHRPPHVHVLCKSDEYIFELECSKKSATLKKAYLRTNHDEEGNIHNELLNHLDHICERWREIHG